MVLTLTANIACGQDEPEPAPKLYRVSQEKLEAAVVKALLQDKAEFHGVVACRERCGSEPDETGEIDYDGNDLPYTYQLPAAKRGGLVAIITAEKPPIYLHKYFVLPLPDCRSFLTKLRAERKPVSIGEEPYAVKVEYGRLSLGENKIDLVESICDIHGGRRPTKSCANVSSRADGKNLNKSLNLNRS